ncbi:hypothetical protein GIB67_021072 [Kingdonia uniflora]|uniref:Large ribosomal subunit protein uL6c n=1 Tax=Kingdonia uniflora TaxID=39325 RepID=A0A7J7N763_9MAGN|nr:hypothetical protein GIB67_021072 [Kingdonia uniflora]
MLEHIVMIMSQELSNGSFSLLATLAVKTCKEAKHMAVIDSISAAKARTEELKYIVQDQKARKNQYAAIISQQLNSLSVLEGNVNKGIKHKENVKDAISWYNKVLGFQIEGGRGVKFIFNNINLQNPNEEFSFSIRHSEDIYTLLDCNPYSGDTKELIQELNQTNGLFKFVRIMREKFQATSLKGALSTHISPFSDSTTNSISAPAASISVDGSESSERDKESQFQPGEVYRPLKKVNHGRVGKSPILSPVAASSHRRSPRFKLSLAANETNALEATMASSLTHSSFQSCNLKSVFLGERSGIPVASVPVTRVTTRRTIECKESRIGKHPIEVPPTVTITLEGQGLKVKGPLGELSRIYPREVKLERLESGEIKVSKAMDTRRANQMHGLFRTLTDNMVVGVSKGFEKKLQLVGVGYRAMLENKDLVLNLGFSHPVRMAIPDDIKVKVEENTRITVSGYDKCSIGEFAASVRKWRPPEPYKGKGVKYADEIVRRKEGKAGKKK